MFEEQFQKRLRIVLVLFLVCFAIIAARAIYFAAGKNNVKASEMLSFRSISIPAHRGAVLDKKGRKLVWTKLRFELWSTLPSGKSFSKKHQKELEKVFPDRNFAGLSDWSVPLFMDLTAGEIADLEPLIRNGYPLKIRTIRLRQKIRSKFVEKRAGDLRNGVGISGWEKEFDSVLRGRNGKCRVMVDSRQNWLPGSFELLEAPQHGKDVFLETDVEEEEKREMNG